MSAYARQLSVLALVCTGVVLFFWWVRSEGMFYSVVRGVQDGLRVSTHPSSDIVIVGIDERSLDRIGAWPWNRIVFAEFIEKLDEYGVRTTSFDVVFSNETESDETLANALRTSNMNIILTGYAVDGVTAFPRDVFTESARVSVGLGHTSMDPDGVVRSVKTGETVNETCVPNTGVFSAIQHMFGVLDCETGHMRIGTWSYALQRVEVAPLRAGSDFTHLSFVDVLFDRIDKNVLNDKLVFVGSVVQDVSSGASDFVPSADGFVSGVHMHASAANTLLTRAVSVPVSDIFSFAALCFAVATGAAVGRYIRPVSGFGAGVAATAIIIAGVFMVRLNGREWFGAYPIFAWWFAWLVGMGYRVYAEQFENRTLRTVFTRYTNAKLLRRIVSSPEYARLGGERKEITVLFSDIRGFTSLSERMTPEGLVSFLNGYLTEATEAVLKHDGVIDKYIGDAIMALWNAPVDDAQHAANACRSALMLQDVARRTDPKIEIGVGINTGHMIVGNMGSKQRFDYTAIGDEVNVASRLEGLTKKYGVGILVGQRTYELARNHSDEFMFRKVDTVTVKGKEKAVDMYELCAPGTCSGFLDAYACAFMSYQTGNFEKARELFVCIHEEHGDIPSLLLSDRCKTCLRNVEIKENWTGVWRWDEK